MKTVILAGGFGTRLSEETTVRPKPMVEIGGKPILWHIMKLYSAFGHHEFVICLGYRGHVIKEYFANYFLHESDVTFDLSRNTCITHDNRSEPWKVTLVETGLDTMTGGRLLRARSYVGDERFMLTYGDGVADVDLDALVAHHCATSQVATVTAAQPAGRFGALSIDETHMVGTFSEKPRGDGHWVSAGFFVFEPQVFDYLEGDATVLEREPLQRLASSGNLKAYRHPGFWMAMDKLSDKLALEQLWGEGRAPWRVW
jgi:glucose-1-phosphate cytidylyltransferase